MDEGLTILKNLVIVFALSTLVNFLFIRIKIPTIVGYLLTGVIAGPLLSLIDEKFSINVMAEIGIILLLFTIGIEFSLQHLLKIRRIVFWGGLSQVIITAGVFYLISQTVGLDKKASILIGFLAALSSSALVLKILQDRDDLSSNYGRTVLGILIFQDLMLVPLLLLTNLLGTVEMNLSFQLLLLAIKVILIITLVYIGYRWLIPKLLHVIALTKNQELFMMSIFLICLAIALLTFKLGMSLAFGAFLAGLMVSESEYSHNVFGNIIPIKDMFTSFFFVSIGMLLDLSFIVENYPIILISVLLLILIKTFIAGGVGFVLGHTFRGTVMIGLALSQVGEFSFLLAKVGFSNAILSNYYYQLFLSVAVITMGFAPFLMKLSIPLANLLLKLPLPEFWIKGMFPLKEIELPNFENHLVIIGKDATALKLSDMARSNKIDHISIIFDPVIAREKMNEGDNVIYGDAIHESILRKAHLEKADTVVISIGNIITSMAVIEHVRHVNSQCYILVRSKIVQDMEQLYQLGADQVIPEKIELAIDLFHTILTLKLYTQDEINQILIQMRALNLGISPISENKLY